IGERRDRDDVDPEYAPRGPDELRRHLQPAAGPRAEVDDRVAAADESRSPLQLGELERRTRAVAFLLRAPVERVLSLVHRIFTSRRRKHARAPAAQYSSATVAAVNFLPFAAVLRYTNGPREFGGGGAAGGDGAERSAARS